jgi:hypothetical protein
VAFVAALVSASPALADVSWQPLGTWSAATAQAFDPHVVVDGRGNSVYIWIWYGGNLCSGAPCQRIQIRTRSAAGVLSPIGWITTQGQQANDPQVAVNANGDAAIVWQTNHQIQTRLRSVAGTFSPTWTLSPPGPADNPQVAVDPSGNAVYVWQRFDGTNERIQTRTLTPAGTRSTTQTLSPAGEDAINPQVALDQHGNAVFAWERYDGANERIQARTRSAAGILAGTQTLSAAGQNAADVHLAVDPSGNAVFTWQRFDDTADRIQARARSAAGTLSSTQTLSASGMNASQPRVGIDLAGNAVILWQRFDGTENRVQVRTRSAAGVLSSTQTLAGTGTTTPVRAQLAVDQQGNALAAWEDRQGTAVCCTAVQARARSADGTLGAARTLSTAGTYAQEPDVAVDPNGHAFAVWDEATDAQTPDGRIHAAAGSY